MENICPNYEKCPIFSGFLAGRPLASDLYKKTYCLKDWQSCKRYLTKLRFGKCPDELAPNSPFTIEEIGKIYKLT